MPYHIIASNRPCSLVRNISLCSTNRSTTRDQWMEIYFWKNNKSIAKHKSSTRTREDVTANKILLKFFGSCWRGCRFFLLQWKIIIITACMWCLWGCKQVLCLWSENNGFRWVNDPSNVVWIVYVYSRVCGQCNHGTAFGHNNIAIKRKQMKMATNVVTKTAKNNKQKRITKSFIGDTSLRSHIWPSNVLFSSINVTFDVFGSLQLRTLWC